MQPSGAGAVTVGLMTTLAEAALNEAERRALDEFVESLREELGEELLAVWLYGSRARGERHEESDIDVLVITRDGKRDRSRVHGLAVDAALAQPGPGIDLMPHIWDPERLQNRREIESFFIQEVDRDKIVLYGDDL